MIAKNRKQKRIAASQLRGSITSTTISLSPHIPKDLNIPKGHRMAGGGGLKVETTKHHYIKRRWWWKLRLMLNKKFRPSIKVEVRFL